MNDIIANIVAAAQPLTAILYLLIVTALADVLSGLWAAWKSGTLSLAYVDDFLKSHVALKWGPIIGTLLGGIAVGGTDGPLGLGLIAAASAQIVAYEAATFGSLTQNLTDGQAGTKGLPGQAIQPIPAAPVDAPVGSAE